MVNRIVMPTDILNDRMRPRKVAEYGRVSTEHEAQISALDNQMQWYDDVAKQHSNWVVVKKYIDEGITGTQAKKRPAFLQMIEDAKRKKFDLIVTREVCRFARNTVDTLVVTRELKSLGIEVYFVDDNIWTMDGDGELRLTIMATLAQEESRKTSERVRAGQKISRDKGVLYGNGNILGYDRDKTTGTYVINPDQAETVKMIYDLYESGMGMTQIRDELFRRKRKDSSGLVRWETAKISRVLHNATYKGYQGYYKSQRNNYLDQKPILNHNEDTYLYVKGNYEPIITEEQWERCKQIRSERRKVCSYFTENGEVRHTVGIHSSNDIWIKKLRCRCGYRMRRNKWRKNKNGDLIYGYKCYNQFNNGTKKTRESAGLSVADACDLREICDWKFDLMARRIFSGIWGDNQDVLDNITSLYKFDFQEKMKDDIEKKKQIQDDIAKLDAKLKKLTRMRLDDEITKEEFSDYKKEIAEEREKLVAKRASYECKDNSANFEMTDTEKMVLSKMDFTAHKIDRDIIEQFVDVVIPRTEEVFEWYLDFDLEGKSEEDKALAWEFNIGYEEALAYRKETDGMLRPTQWKDLTVKVYI